MATNDARGQNPTDYEPTGDPDHVAYGKDFYWVCTCGASGAHLTTKSRATHRAQRHAEYCRADGTTTVRVSV